MTNEVAEDKVEVIPTIHSCILISGKTYGPKNVKAFTAVKLPAKEMRRLQDGGVISGFDIPEEEIEVDLPAVKHLAEYIFDKDRDVVEAMLEADTRPTATQIYQERLDVIAEDEAAAVTE